MRKTLLRFSLSMFSLMLAACVNEEIDTKGTIAGIITDAINSTPLKDASVTLNPSGRTYTTGADGRYEFKDIDFGSYTVAVRKTNYVSDERSVEVRVAETSNLDFQLKPANSQLEVVQKTLDFGEEATSLSLDIKNSGYAELTWQLTENITWLTCNPTSGAVESGKQQAVVVMVDRSGLEPRSYSENITITSNGGSATVQVGLTVQGIQVKASPEQLNFGATTTSLTLTLTNKGSSSVNYTLTPSNDWIIPSVTSGIFTYSTDVTITVNRAGMSEGDYSGSLQLRVNDRTLVIPVSMHIARRELPTVNLTLVAEVTTSTATFKGAVVSIGSSRISRHGFCWSTTEEPEIEKDAFCNLGDCTSPKDFSYGAANLIPDTRYYVRAYAENDEGVNYSGSMTFKTLSLPEAPTIETGSASNILTNEARVSGTIVKVGNDAGIIQYGHVWDTKTDPTTASYRTELGATKATGPYTSTLTDLKPNVTYYVRAYATNAIGTSYGEEITFTTIPDVVKLTTLAATDITHNEATLGGSISDTGGNAITERGVCFGTEANPTLSGTHAASSSTADRFTVRLTELTPRTTYHARAYVTTEAETTYYGDDITFTTTYEIFPGEVGATTVSAFGTTFATFNSTIVSSGNGTVSDCGFVYALASGPTLNQGTKLSCGERQSGDFSSTATNLKENTTYYVRAYITNDKGTAYGDETSFTTLAITVPKLSSVTVSDVTASAAIFEAQVVDFGNGTLTDAGFVLGTSPNPVTDHRRLSCGATSDLSATASGLQRATTYYVRAYAINEKGTAYGEQQTFTTPAEAVSLTTSGATDVTHNAATLGGSISDDGGNNIAERGVCYGTSANPDINGMHTPSSSTDDRFTVRLTDLSERTEYHARAYTTTKEGTTYYGNDVTFTTTHEIHPGQTSKTTISAIGTTTATFQSTITSDGSGTVSDCGFVFARTPSPTTESGTVLSCGAKQTGTFTTTANDLRDNTTYYVRSYVTNQAGTSYGEEVNFATLEIVKPTLSEVTVNKVTYQSVSLTATVLSAGNGTILEAGFVYSTSSSPDMNSTKVVCASSPTLSARISGLAAETTYHVRAFATNEKGTTLGEVVTFTTEKDPGGNDVSLDDYDDDNDWDN